MAVKKNKKFAITRNQVLIAVLIFVLFLNTLTHFSQPAYRYYKEISQQLFKQQGEFRNEVRNDLLPALYLVLTNRTVVTTGVVTNIETTVTQVPLDLPDETHYKTLTFEYCVADSRPFIVFEGRYYTLGDAFLFEPILAISPHAFRTQSTVFVLPVLTEKQNNVKGAPL